MQSIQAVIPGAVPHNEPLERKPSKAGLLNRRSTGRREDVEN